MPKSDYEKLTEAWEEFKKVTLEIIDSTFHVTKFLNWLAELLRRQTMMRCLIFAKADTYKNVAIRKDAIIAFDYIADQYGEYRVFLNGGGTIDIRAGQGEYEQLVDAIKYGDELRIDEELYKKSCESLAELAEEDR